MTEDDKMAFAMMVLGYEIWSTFGEVAINTSRKIDIALGNSATNNNNNFDQNALIQEYFDKNWTKTDTQLSVTGSTNGITSVQ